MTPSDSTNSTDDTSVAGTVSSVAAAPVVPPPDHSIWGEIKALEAKVEASALAKLNAMEDEWDDVVWPYIKKNTLMLLTDVGQAALSATLTEIPTMIAGGWAAAAAVIGTAVVTTAATDIKADAPSAMQTVQAAMQVIKSASNTVTAGDAPTVAAIQVAANASTDDTATA